MQRQKYVELKQPITELAAQRGFFVDSHVQVLACLVSERIGSLSAQHRDLGEFRAKGFGNASALGHEKMNIHAYFPPPSPQRDLSAGQASAHRSL